MKTTTSSVVPLLLMAVVGVPAALAAQGGTISGMVIEVEGEQGAGVSVAALLNGIKTPLGTTGPDGRTVIDPERVDIGVGTPVQVYGTGCNGARDIVLVPRGEVLAADEDCPRPVGFFSWGEVRALTFGVGPTGWALAKVYRPGLDLGVTVHGGVFNNFEDQVCAQPAIGDCSADEFTTGFGAFAEYRLGSRYPVLLGLNVSYATHDISQTFEFPGTSPVTRTGSVGGLFADFYVGYRLPLTRSITLTPHIGPTWARDNITFDPIGGLRDDLLGSRSESGFKMSSGVNVDVPVWERVKLRVGYDFTHAFDGDDADLNHRVTVGGGMALGTPFASF